MEELVRKLPNRIVALRIHATQDPKLPPSAGGAIRDRDLRAPAIRTTIRKAHELGLGIQFHLIPYYARHVAALAAEFSGTMMILDHLARAAQGTPEEYEEVLRLARFSKVVMKYSAVQYASRQPHPHDDARPLVRRVYDAFGPDRIIWGGLGHNMKDFHRHFELLDRMFDFASAADRAKIRGGNAIRLYGLMGGRASSPRGPLAPPVPG